MTRTQNIHVWTVTTRFLYPWGLSQQEHWNGLPCPSSGDLPNSGIELRSPALQTDYFPAEPQGKESKSATRPESESNIKLGAIPSN